MAISESKNKIYEALDKTTLSESYYDKQYTQNELYSRTDGFTFF
jgi:hypothetical protein